MTPAFRPPCDEAQIRAAAAGTPCSPAATGYVLAATILGSSMVFIDGAAVNVALPAFQAALDADVVDVQWIIEAYALFLAALLLIGGALGDRYGRRRVYTVGVVLFALASLWCGLAPNVGQLILARSAQGVGGALLVPGSLAIISASFDPGSRGKAIGTWAGFTAITAAIGPVLGGWLIEHVSWRAIFLINLPLAIAVVVLVMRHVRESRDPDLHSLDWPGAALATVFLGLLTYGLIESARTGFRALPVVAALGTAAVSGLGFLIRESRAGTPMLPLTLFRSRTFAGANLLTLFLYAALSGVLFFFPLDLIQVQGYSATAAGAAILPFVLLMFLLSRWSGGLLQRYGPVLPLVAGPLVAALGFGLFMVPGVGGSYWTTFFPAVVVLGLGMAIAVAPLTTTVMNAVDQDRVGIASGVNNAVSRTAAVLAIAVLGLVMLGGFNRHLDRALTRLQIVPEVRRQIEAERIHLAGMALPESLSPAVRSDLRAAVDDAFVAGFRTTLAVAVVLALLSALAAGGLVRREDVMEGRFKGAT